VIQRFISRLLRNRVLILMVGAAVGGIGIWAFETLPVDALPDVSENQVIVSVDWPGVSPRDMEDQVTYPLASSLQGLPGVAQVRATSSFGFAQIYVVFGDRVEFYWARERVSERLAETSASLPAEAAVSLGPDATPLGQIYWYTVQGPYDLATLRSIQDYTIMPALQSVPGVSEVAGVGGFRREYLVEADPDRLRHLGLGLHHINSALAAANTDVGAGTVEQSGMEFIVRGVGRIRSIEDIESSFVAVVGGRPVTVGEVASVSLGPGFRRGALADGRGELVGGIVVMRHGADPVAVIEAVEERLDRLSSALPPGVEVAAYYDRRELITETMRTLTDAITWQIVITVLVVLAFLLHVKTSLVVASTLPFAVLLTFIGMRLLGVTANIMSFAGIAIAIGTIVDMGIVVTESIHQEHALGSSGRGIPRAVGRVAPAVFTSLSTTVISGIPVFFLQGQSGKLFVPLAWSNTLVLLAAGLMAFTIVPVLSSFMIAGRKGPEGRRSRVLLSCLGLGLVAAWASASAGAWLPPLKPWFLAAITGALVSLSAYRMAAEPLESAFRDRLEKRLATSYAGILNLAMARRGRFMAALLIVITGGTLVVFGADRLFLPIRSLGINPDRIRPVQLLVKALPGIGTQFMPPLDEGSFLFMPSLLSQASLNEAVDVMVRQNRAMERIPEVRQVVGKAGRADSPLDPAPVGMIETVITLNPRETWREGVTADSLLSLLRASVRMPGIAPSWLQPIETRIVMLQSGIVTSIGLEIHGDDVDQLQRIAIAAEGIIREIPGTANVSAMRATRRPYLEVTVDREAAALYGLTVEEVLTALQGAMSGMVATTVRSGRERIPVRARYFREMRDEPADIGRIYIPVHGSEHRVLLSRVASIETVRGPAMIRSVNGELVGYVMLNAEGRDEGGLVEEADALLRRIVQEERHMEPHLRRLDLPEGYYFQWVGNYRNQIQARNRFAILIPICLATIFLLMYMQFRTMSVPLIIFLGTVPLAVAGGFIFIAIWPGIHSVLWSAGMIGVPPEGAVYLTVAVVVGFIALLGICVDDGVLMATYITQLRNQHKPRTRPEVRALVRKAVEMRIRPAVMTTVTTLVALVPVLLASGRGSDLARPMALPVFGGMLIELATIMVVPVVYSWWLERGLPEKMPA